MLKNILHDRKTNAAQNDQTANRKHAHRVRGIAENIAAAKKIEAGIAKAGHGMPVPIVNPAPARFAPKTQRKYRPADEFQEQRDLDYITHPMHHALKGKLIQGFLNQQALAELDTAAQQDSKQRRQGHNAQAAHLDQ